MILYISWWWERSADPDNKRYGERVEITLTKKSRRGGGGRSRGVMKFGRGHEGIQSNLKVLINHSELVTLKWEKGLMNCRRTSSWPQLKRHTVLTELLIEESYNRGILWHFMPLTHKKKCLNVLIRLENPHNAEWLQNCQLLHVTAACGEIWQKLALAETSWSFLCLDNWLCHQNGPVCLMSSSAPGDVVCFKVMRSRCSSEECHLCIWRRA